MPAFVVTEEDAQGQIAQQWECDIINQPRPFYALICRAEQPGNEVAVQLVQTLLLGLGVRTFSVGASLLNHAACPRYGGHGRVCRIIRGLHGTPQSVALVGPGSEDIDDPVEQPTPFPAQLPQNIYPYGTLPAALLALRAPFGTFRCGSLSLSAMLRHTSLTLLRRKPVFPVPFPRFSVCPRHEAIVAPSNRTRCAKA